MAKQVFTLNAVYGPKFCVAHDLGCVPRQASAYDAVSHRMLHPKILGVSDKNIDVDIEESLGLRKITLILSE